MSVGVWKISYHIIMLIWSNYYLMIYAEAFDLLVFWRTIIYFFLISLWKNRNIVYICVIILIIMRLDEIRVIIKMFWDKYNTSVWVIWSKSWDILSNYALLLLFVKNDFLYFIMFESFLTSQLIWRTVKNILSPNLTLNV